MSRSMQFLLGALALAVPFFSTGEAQAAASLSACGNVFVAGEAQCELQVEGGCTAMCEPVSFQASCAAQLKAECDGQCTASADVDCQADCSADCSGRCDVDPGSFNCEADCQGECAADCSGRCSADSDSAECEASCKATCSGTCNARCSGTPPSADCSAKCEASCSGHCEAEANVDCQIECQADGFVDCEAELQGGCEAQCSRPEGAMFCDGQFVNSDNLDDCIAALKSYLNIMVEGSASCEGNTCMAEGSVACSCTAANDEAPALAGLLGLGVIAATRRRRR